MNRKIVIVGPAYPYRGGQSLVEAHLFDSLERQGYDCTTISFRLLYPTILFPGTTQYDNSTTLFYAHRKKIKRVINSINPISWQKTIRVIKEIDPVITLFVWWTPYLGPAYSWIARGIRKQTGSKVGFLTENYISHEQKWFDHFLSKKTLEHADFFITHSKHIKSRIEEYQSIRPVYATTLPVFSCFNLNQWNKQSAKEHLGLTKDKVILYFGLVRPYKALGRLIEAMKHLGEEFSEVELLVAGEFYDSKTKYLDLIDSSPEPSRITVVDKFISNEEVELYFKAADVVCLPYRSGTQSGIQMMAYGFGVPVVVTDVGGLAECVVEGKTGTIVPESEPKLIAEGIERVLTNKTGENFPHNIEQHAKELGYHNISQIIDDVLA